VWAVVFLSSCDWDPQLFSGVRISIVGMEETFLCTDLEHKQLESFHFHERRSEHLIQLWKGTTD
jgi:hypothetical protein